MCTFQLLTISIVIWCRVSLVPRPQGLVTSGWYLGLHLHWLLSGEKYLSANHIAEKKICSEALEILGSSAWWHSTFLAHKLVIGSQLCIQQTMNFLMKPKESAGCHRTLSAQVGSGDKTSVEWSEACIWSHVKSDAKVIVAMYRQDDTKTANLLGRRWPY